ncbi:uncharacterized protein LOC117344460 [Pecten maximus]|uniref:uncharacterized protein LOC117344460 n=1 Tax=Pecten maximus TaxID=6579 RepID=UPI001458BD87|nr:uncharacterized protein LOC117344460 [Pecten maximus]
MLRVCYIVVFLTLAVVQAQHNGHHHNTEHGTVSFVYDPVSHYLVARTHSTCYFMALDNHQVHQIHQVNGLDQLELQMMASINGQEEELSTSVQAQLYSIVEHRCNHHTLYLTNAGATTTPSH